MFKELALIGPTACGKSDIAIEVARRYNAIILSLDSLCIYKFIDIVSAKPSKKSLQEIIHFGIDIKFPNEKFNVGEFIIEYKNARQLAITKNVPLIITGGSSFYLKSMLSGLAPKVEDAKEFPDNTEIYKIAMKIDPDFCAKFSIFDTYRVQKWFSIYQFCGYAPTKFLKDNTKPPIIKELKIFEIKLEKEELRNKIVLRTNNMIKNGLIDEAKLLFSKYDRREKALNCIGLKECGMYLNGCINIDELTQLIINNTNSLAKRQKTFNKSQFIDKISDIPSIINIKIDDFLNQYQK